MPRRLWSLPLDGDRRGGATLRWHASSGRLLVSTCRAVEASAPDGLSHMKIVTVGNSAAPADSTVTRYVNSHARRCSAIDHRGQIAWTRCELVARGEAPDGRIVATNDQHELVMLDANGRELERQSETESKPWAIIGWRDDGPVLAGAPGTVWVEPFGYRLFERHLHCYSALGAVVAKIAIPRAPFDHAYRQRPDLGAWREPFRYPSQFDLHHDPVRRRLIANNWMMPACTMALNMEGIVEWVTLLGPGCCNSICSLGDALVHASSCGHRLSFLSPDGVVFRTHDLEDPPGQAFADGNHHVCVTVRDKLHSFDARGELRWTLETPGIDDARAYAGVLYVVTEGPTERLELTAFDIA